MDICATNGTLGVRLSCIASYNGSLFDCILNYTATALTSWALFMSAASSFPPAPQRHRRKLRRRQLRLVSAACMLVFFTLFQFGLCLALGCDGVSVIWAAALGATWTATLASPSSWRRRRPPSAIATTAAPAAAAASTAPTAVASVVGLGRDAAARSGSARGPRRASISGGGGGSSSSSNNNNNNRATGLRTSPSSATSTSASLPPCGCRGYVWRWRPLPHVPLLAVSFVDALLLAYYGVTLSPITTVAHVAALAMGTATERLAAWLEGGLCLTPGCGCCGGSSSRVPRADSEEPMLQQPAGYEDATEDAEIDAVRGTVGGARGGGRGATAAAAAAATTTGESN